jgi:hypothetical protein
MELIEQNTRISTQRLERWHFQHTSPILCLHSTENPLHSPRLPLTQLSYKN